MEYTLRLNSLINTEILSDQKQFDILYKYLGHLDKYCAQNTLHPFHNIVDHRTYFVEKGYPAAKVQSVNEYLKKEGAWHNSKDSLDFLRTLKHKLENKPIKFGWFPNHYNRVITELDYSINFITECLEKNAKFNFCIISKNKFANTSEY